MEPAQLFDHMQLGVGRPTWPPPADSSSRLFVLSPSLRLRDSPHGNPHMGLAFGSLVRKSSWYEGETVMAPWCSIWTVCQGAAHRENTHPFSLFGLPVPEI